MRKDSLVIIGASGHGKVIADIAIKMNQWKSIAFLDDNEEVKSCLGFEVIGKTNDFLTYKEEADFIVAIGNNEIRENIQEQIVEQGLSIATLIHPSAIIGTDVKIGTGVVVMAGVVINSSTSIGKGCIINTSSSVDHDNEIGDYVHISPGANLAGNVRVGKGSWIGIGVSVNNNISISSGVMVGAGTVVIKDLPENCIAVGVPARVIRFNR